MVSTIIGVLGAQGCGKSALVRALTGEETDRLKEEQERGLSIEAAFAPLELEDGGMLSMADLPGHERYARHLIAGLAGARAVLLVVAADQGVMAQTREHLTICRLLGIEQGCIAITSTDRVDTDLLAMVRDEIGELVRGSFLQGIPVYHLSSVTGEGVAAMRSALAGFAARSEKPEGGKPFRMTVDRTFTLPDGGVVVTGAALSGCIEAGTEVLLYPRMLSARVKSIQLHSRPVAEASVGSRVAVNLRGLDETMIARGDIVAAPGSLTPSHILDVDFSYLAWNSTPFQNRTQVRVHLGAAEIAGHVVLLESEELPRGERAAAQLFLEELAGAWPGDRFLIRSYSPPTILGGGVVRSGIAGRRKRHSHDTKDIFSQYRRGRAEELALLHVRESGFPGLTMPELAVRLGLFDRRLRKALEGPLSTRRLLMIDAGRQQLLSREVYEAMKERTIRILVAFHDEFPDRDGLPEDELRAMIYGGMDPKLMGLILDDLDKGGEIVRTKETVSLSPDRPLSAHTQERLRFELENLYRTAALSPPTPREVAASYPRQGVAILRGVLDDLAAAGVLCRVNDDLYFHGETLAQFREKIVYHLREQGDMDIQAFKTLTGMTRKFLIPLLEHLDVTGVTQRGSDNTRKLRLRLRSPDYSCQQTVAGQEGRPCQ